MPKSRYSFYYNDLVCETLILSRDLQTLMQLPQLLGVICTASTVSGGGSKDLSLQTASASPQTVLTQGALQVITGQKAKISRGKKSIAAFHLRKGGVVGCMVTLRRLRFYLFLDQIITCILPLALNTADRPSLISSHTQWGKNTFFEFSQLEPFFAQFENTKGLHINIMVDAKLVKSSSGKTKGQHFFRDLL